MDILLRKKATSQGSENLSSKIFAVTKERIIRLEYLPGSRLTEQELCEEFQVSRSPVREALRMLVENDLVDKVPHGGYHIRDISLNEINELYDVRLAIESYVVEFLAKNGIPEDTWADLYRMWETWLTNDPEPGAIMARYDETFHEALAQATGNKTLTDFLCTVNERLHFLRMHDITTIERLRETSRQHIQILESIRAKDAERARWAVQKNIELGRNHVERALKEALARAYTTHKESRD